MQDEMLLVEDLMLLLLDDTSGGHPMRVRGRRHRKPPSLVGAGYPRSSAACTSGATSVP